MTNKKGIDKAAVLIAKERIKKYRSLDPLKFALLLSLVLGLFMNVLFGFTYPDSERISGQTRIKKYGFPLAYREWTETTCQGYVFKICEKSNTRYNLINFLADQVVLGGFTFLIGYLMVAWNIQGPPWRYYSRFDFEK